MKSLKPKIVLKVLEDNGFLVVRQKGSHMILQNNEKRMVPVAVHGTREIPVGTLINIIKQSGLDKKLFEQ